MFELKNNSKLEVLKIKSFLEQIRKPQLHISLNKQIAETAGIILFGFALGVLQKRMDGAPVNAFLVVMQQFDVGNYFDFLPRTYMMMWIIGVIVLRRKPKEYLVVIGLSVVIAFVYQLVMPHWG